MKQILVVALRDDELYFRQFIEPITNQFRSQKFIVKYYEELLSINIQDYSHIIVAGTYMKDSSYIENIEKFSWINSYKNNLLGICAGAQIICLLNDFELNSLKEITLLSLDILFNDPLFTSVSFDKCYTIHNYIFSLPKDFQVLAKCNSIPRIAKKDKIYLISFHPEVYQKNILTNFINL